MVVGTSCSSCRFLGQSRRNGRLKWNWIIYLPMSILVIENAMVLLRWFWSTNSRSWRHEDDCTHLHDPLLDFTTLLSSSFATKQTDLTFSVVSYPSLRDLTSSDSLSSHSACPIGLVWIANKIERPLRWTDSNATNIFPRIIHQTAKSRCITPAFARAMDQWQQLTGWSYYLHDDVAIERLFQSVTVQQQFPLLRQVIPTCVIHGTIRADIWRYLILWIYGGIYADLDTVPGNHFDLTAVTSSSTDAYFVVEQYHMLSQYFMAARPYHPIMWYALQQALRNVRQANDISGISAAMMTGPHALHFAFQRFGRDNGLTIGPAGQGYQPVQAGSYRGSFDRTVTVVGVAQDQNAYIQRDVIGKHKIRDYERMNMTHFQRDKLQRSGLSCEVAIRQHLDK